MGRGAEQRCVGRQGAPQGRVHCGRACRSAAVGARARSRGDGAACVPGGLKRHASGPLTSNSVPQAPRMAKCHSKMLSCEARGAGRLGPRCCHSQPGTLLAATGPAPTSAAWATTSGSSSRSISRSSCGRGSRRRDGVSGPGGRAGACPAAGIACPAHLENPLHCRGSQVPVPSHRGMRGLLRCSGPELARLVPVGERTSGEFGK